MSLEPYNSWLIASGVFTVLFWIALGLYLVNLIYG